jgi:hypothetical protein
MTAPFDIFAVEHEGVMWLGSAENLEAAKARVAVRPPGEYLLLDHHTGKKLIIKPGCEPQVLES